ncbi:hypothetical protein LMIY3S_03724 [Labrys miyagiensis]
MTKPELFYYGGGEQSSKPYHYKECGLDNIFLMNGFTFENVDDEEYVSIHNVKGLWKAIGLSLVSERKTFSPAEIRFLRSQMKLTQSELADMLRVDDQTVARWEKKHCKLPGPADVALRFLFLSSDIAQPEGKEILVKLHEMVRNLVDQDDPVLNDLHFIQTSEDWEPTRAAA